jgi:hypothetical protein
VIARKSAFSSLLIQVHEVKTEFFFKPLKERERERERKKKPKVNLILS